MASAFGHAFAAFALGKTFAKTLMKPSVLLLGIASSILPDADVMAFKFGIPYESFWGHRGFSHSFVFAALWAALLAFVYFRKASQRNKNILFFYFFLATASHAILDAMTSGGKGVALFAPFDNSRYFLPWRPIKVSPIGVESFFSEWGLKVIGSEIIWIGIPGIILMIIVYLLRLNKSN